MGDEWQEVPLGDFVRLRRGHDLTADERRPGSIPVMGSAGQSGWHDTAKAAGPGVVIGRSGVGSMGAVHYSPGSFWPHNTTLYVTNFLGNNPRFSYYLLSSLNFRRYNSGSAQASLNRNYLYGIPVLRPPLPYQGAIVHILGSLDDKIALNRKMNETLEEMARALFKSWFVDFDPVHAKARGEKPYGMDDATAALFPDSFEESELGPIPTGWKVSPLLELAELISGGTPKTKEPSYWGGEIKWASAKDVSKASERYLVATERTITERGLNESSTKLITAGAVAVVARGATCGRWTLFGETMAMNQTCYALRARTEQYTRFVQQVVPSSLEGLVRQAHGSVFDTITTGTFRTARTVVPPPALSVAFDAVVEPMERRILTAIHESRDLASTRDTLLPRLVSGSLAVSAMEQVIGEEG